MEHEGDSDTDCNCRVRNDPQMLGKSAGKVENRRTNRSHPKSTIVEIGQKSPGDMKRFVFTQTPVKDLQLTLMGKLVRSKIMTTTKTKITLENNKLNTTE